MFHEQFLRKMDRTGFLKIQNGEPKKTIPDPYMYIIIMYNIYMYIYIYVCMYIYITFTYISIYESVSSPMSGILVLNNNLCRILRDDKRALLEPPSSI